MQNRFYNKTPNLYEENSVADHSSSSTSSFRERFRRIESVDICEPFFSIIVAKMTKMTSRTIQSIASKIKNSLQVTDSKPNITNTVYYKSIFKCWGKQIRISWKTYRYFPQNVAKVGENYQTTKKMKKFFHFSPELYYSPYQNADTFSVFFALIRLYTSPKHRLFIQ